MLWRHLSVDWIRAEIEMVTTAKLGATNEENMPLRISHSQDLPHLYKRRTCVYSYVRMMLLQFSESDQSSSTFVLFNHTHTHTHTDAHTRTHTHLIHSSLIKKKNHDFYCNIH